MSGAISTHNLAMLIVKACTAKCNAVIPIPLTKEVWLEFRNKLTSLSI